MVGLRWCCGRVGSLVQVLFYTFRFHSCGCELPIYFVVAVTVVPPPPPPLVRTRGRIWKRGEVRTRGVVISCSVDPPW